MVTLQCTCPKCGCTIMAIGYMTRYAANKELQEHIDKCQGKRKSEENGTERLGS